MKPKMTLKLCVDGAMTIALLLLMAYELIGKAAHEWIGMAMFLLFVLHHILNGKWVKNLLKGRYTPLRTLQTVLAAVILLCMFGSMVSGIVLSEYTFAFLNIREGQSWARTLHMLSSYWGFVLMALHLGLHWGMILQMAKKRFGFQFPGSTWPFPVIATAVAIYGIFAVVHREIGSYLFLKSEFVFFNFEEPLVFFFLDYLAITGTFVFIGHYLTKLLRQWGKRHKAE